MTESPPPASPDSMIGKVLLGRYRIVRALAEGGMGIVYLARVEGAAGFRKPVVLKQVLQGLSQRPHYMGMFVREAQILAQLRHPGIVDVIELGEHEGGYVMVLEYVSGFHLGQWHAFRRHKGQPIPTESCIQIMAGVLDALHHVHTQVLPDGTALNITHRDVSPSNILLDTDGFAKLVDFGVARMEVDTLYRTEGRGFRGKLAYSAPELFDGAEATPQTDVYACGVVLHELLVGRNEFAGSTQAETLQRAVHYTASSVHGVRDDAPEDIDSIVGKALAKSRAQRYASASDFAQALRRTLRTPERALREQLGAQVRADFNGELASVLGIESLASRDRAWRRFSTAPPALENEPKSPLRVVSFEEDPGIHEQPTRVSRGLQLSEAGAPLGDEEATPTIASQPPLLAVGSDASAQPAKPAKPRALRYVVLAVAAVAILGVGLWSSLSHPPAVAPAPKLVVLQTTITPAPAPAVTTPPAPAPAPVPPSSADAIEKTDEPQAMRARATHSPSERSQSAAPRGPNATLLTSAFRRKQREVESCYASEAQEGSTQSEILFRIDAAGRVLEATVFPAQLQNTTLGKCLERVARATRFPSQGEALAFRIPVTARRVN